MGFKDRELSRQQDKSKFSVIDVMSTPMEKLERNNIDMSQADKKMTVTFYIPNYLNRAITLKCANDGIGKSVLIVHLIEEHCRNYTQRARELCELGIPSNKCSKKIKVISGDTDNKALSMVKVTYSMPSYLNKSLELMCAEQDTGKSALISGILDKACGDYVEKAKKLCS